MKVAGWLFDAYPQGDRMVFWVKREGSGRMLRLEERWSHSIYVASDSKSGLLSIAKDDRLLLSGFIKSWEFVEKYERITDSAKSKVLKLTLEDSTQTQTLAKRIMLAGRFGQFRLYNVDVMPAQSYFYEHGLFPLAFCEVAASHNHLLTCADDVWSVDYALPELRTAHLKVIPQKQQGRLPKYTDRIASVQIKCESETIEVAGSDEIQTLYSLADVMARLDPDVVFTDGGDSFWFPYLAHRAEANDCSSILALGREPGSQLRKPVNDGASYFSYGRIHYRPSSTQLLGRVHIDTQNSFILDEAGMHGLVEVARICRMPLHKASRASIGWCMSSLQFYHAFTKDILIPWKPSVAEHLKTYSELLVADRGGMIFEPRVGVHEQVAEFDFMSLYPSIMSKKNLSGETVLCDCCSKSKNRVPELGWHICEKRVGIVPQSLEILLKKRAQYKALMKSQDTDSEKRKIYDARQGSLKWILVTSFGYLGYSNSKFGRIDAHIATCAFDREILLKSVRVAEQHGFRVLHGIVDSLWVIKKGAQKHDYLALKEAIEKATGFTISFEGVYKWVAFVHSKVSRQVPVPNRYFGVFEEDGKLKVRGIEMRRHDNPPFFDKFQAGILKIMAGGNTVAEVKALMPQVEETFRRYVQLLEDRQVRLEELVFTKQLSKDSDDYLVNNAERSSLQRLREEGKLLRAGEVLRYLITDYYSSSSRTVPIDMATDKTLYDVKRYIELLADNCNSLIQPFGHALDHDTASSGLHRRFC